MLYNNSTISKLMIGFYRHCSSTARSANKVKSVNFKNIRHILQNGQENQEIRFQGWVRVLRRQKEWIFFDVNDGSTMNRISIVLPSKNKPEDLSLHSTVDVAGILVKSPKNPNILEVKPYEDGGVKVIGPCDPITYPFGGKSRYNSEHLRHFPHLRIKTNKFSSLMRLRSQLTKSISDFFNENQFVQIHTPILTSNDCEGAGEVFSVKPNNEDLLKTMLKENQNSQKEGESGETSNVERKKTVVPDPEDIFFDKRTYLSVSSQLHLECAARGLDKVWTISPVFRSENQISTRHLSEFYMVESEISFAFEIQDILEIIEQLVKTTIKNIIENHFDEWKFHTSSNLTDEEFQNHKKVLEKIVNNPFTIMTFDEAQILLREKLNSIVKSNRGFNREQELLLVEKLNNGIPIFVINWPKDIKPFYMRETPGDSSKVSAVDLLVPMVGELCGGSLREDNLEKLQFNLNKFDPTGKLSSSLDWYFDLRRFGGVPSGGFGLGLDRLLQLITKNPNIKDVCFVPRSSHYCPM